jgi:hypothetical protein
MTGSRRPKVEALPMRVTFIVQKVTSYSYGRFEAHAFAELPHPHLQNAELVITMVATTPLRLRAGDRFAVDLRALSDGAQE